MHATPEEEAPALLSLLMPLHYFYAQEERPLPQVEILEREALDEPQRGLLVHEGDMTSRLARHHGGAITLEVLAREETPDYILRMVLLRRARDGRPVEFGAIGIRLEAFEGPIREKIVSGSAPLGALLEQYRIDYRSCPKAYFAMISDRRISQALGEIEGARLFGRCNALTDVDGIVFADIVEVLPGESDFDTEA